MTVCGVEKHGRGGEHSTGRVANIHRMPEVAGPFPQKSLIISGSFADNDLQLGARQAEAH